MQRLGVTYRPKALDDLHAIFRFIVERGGSEVVARRFVERIMARCLKIGAVPFGGRSRDDLFPGLRTVPFERIAVIAYRVGDAVEITNVFYRGRDYEALYRNAADEEG